jgi:hypothetical protein
MALMALLILSALAVAFSVLSSSEPTIANNQLRVAQARAVAEAGLERAAWALTNPGATGGLTDPLPSPVPPPYNGSLLVMLSAGGSSIGGYRVTVSPAASGFVNERDVVSVGWVPNDTTTAVGKAHQRIRATLTKFRFLDPPCALCVGGDVQIGGSTLDDSRGDTSCGAKSGALTTGIVDAQGTADIFGADGNSTKNQVGTSPPADIVQGFDPSSFLSYMFSNGDLDALKAYAKSQGTYYQGSVTFNSSNRMPNGVIFVDTTTGQNIDVAGAGTTPTSEFADVTISGNPAADPGGVFKGWIIVNGRLTVNGNFKADGMLYAQNDISYRGVGDGRIIGQMISRNIRDTVATQIDSDLTGNSRIIYNCAAAKTGGGFVPQSWVLKAGSYKEVSD